MTKVVTFHSEVAGEVSAATADRAREPEGTEALKKLPKREQAPIANVYRGRNDKQHQDSHSENNQTGK